MHISVVSPVYKAENIVDELVSRVIQSVSRITEDFEIILVDDGSPDSSWGSIEKNCKKDERVRGIKLTRNFGQHYAITCGLDYCSGDWVVIMDCDLQDLPEEITKLYAKAQEGCDVVLACRGRRKDGFLKKFVNLLFYKVFNYLTDMNCDPQVGVYRIISKQVVENFRQIRESNRYFYGLIQWMGFSTTTVDVAHGERLDGKSSYDFKKLFSLAIKTIISFSDKPLRAVTILGLIISAIAFVCGICIFVRALAFGSPVTGWTSLFVSLYFLCGMIITILGMIGIYLGNTFSEVKKRPMYIISGKIGL